MIQISIFFIPKAKTLQEKTLSTFWLKAAGFQGRGHARFNINLDHAFFFFFFKLN